MADENIRVQQVAWGGTVKTPRMKRRTFWKKAKKVGGIIGREALSTGKGLGRDILKTPKMIYREVKGKPAKKEGHKYKFGGYKHIPVKTKKGWTVKKVPIIKRVKRIKKVRRSYDTNPFGLGELNFDLDFRV